MIILQIIRKLLFFSFIRRLPAFERYRMLSRGDFVPPGYKIGFANFDTRLRRKLCEAEKRYTRRLAASRKSSKTDDVWCKPTPALAP